MDKLNPLIYMSVWNANSFGLTFVFTVRYIIYLLKWNGLAEYKTYALNFYKSKL